MDMRFSSIFLCVSLLLSPAVGNAAYVSSNWYAATPGLTAWANGYVPSIPWQVRQRFQAQKIVANHSNSWIVWASAWSSQGGKAAGKALIQTLELDAVDAQGNATPLDVTQWQTGTRVTGHCYQYDAWHWFGSETSLNEAFSSGGPNGGAVIDTGVAGALPAVCHLWQTHWPRDVAPAGTVKLRVKATFTAIGDALINVGLDRYKTSTGDDKPEQEVLVSDTYTSQQGSVTVVMDTPNISWQ